MERRRIDIDNLSSTGVCRIPPISATGSSLKQSRLTKRNLGIALSIIGAMVNILIMGVGIVLLVAAKQPKLRWISQISHRQWGGIFIVGFLLSIIAWSPWITNQYAIETVIDNLGGPDATYNYLGENITLQEIPTSVATVPFFRLVYFPGEAMYIVTFWGGVLGTPSLGLDSAGD
ncbi:MAG: hypothetical protein KAR33_10575 [Candidatus Thorarchaeota archaeon]|nr:hypothetical protein [Candidatus Thorarchaeota archaeon]